MISSIVKPPTDDEGFTKVSLEIKSKICLQIDPCPVIALLRELLDFSLFLSLSLLLAKIQLFKILGKSPKGCRYVRKCKILRITEFN